MNGDVTRRGRVFPHRFPILGLRADSAGFFSVSLLILTRIVTDKIYISSSLGN